MPVPGKLNPDSLPSVTRLPPGMPVVAVDMDRGDNGALLAAGNLALSDAGVARRLAAWRQRHVDKAVEDSKTMEVAA